MAFPACGKNYLDVSENRKGTHKREFLNTDPRERYIIAIRKGKIIRKHEPHLAGFSTERLFINFLQNGKYRWKFPS